MAAQHFTFLGYRKYDLERDADGDDVSARGSRQRARHPARARDRAAGGTGTASDSFSRLPAAIRAKARERTLLVLTKANARSTVHRPTYLDYVGVKRYDAAGNVIGEHRFLGLYTSSAYTGSPIDIPVLRRKVSEVISRRRFAPREPRLQGPRSRSSRATPATTCSRSKRPELFDIAMGILNLQERRRVRMFVHREQYGRFVSCLVFVPRDRYTTPVRVRIADVLIDAFGASAYEWNTLPTASVLARLHFVLRRSVGVARPDGRRRRGRSARRRRGPGVDRRPARRARAAHGEEDGLDLLRAWSGAFPASYQEDVPAPERVADLAMLTTLDATAMPPLRRPAGGRRRPSRPRALRPRRATVALGGAPAPHEHGRDRRRRASLHDHAGRSARTLDQALPPARPGRDAAAAYDLFEDAFLAMSAGDTEDDVFNQLVLLAGLSWREVALLRAYSRYLRQVGTPFSQTYVATTLAAHPEIARKLIELFTTRLDPGAARPADHGMPPSTPRSPPRSTRSRASTKTASCARCCTSCSRRCARTGSRPATTAGRVRAWC